MSQLEFGRSVAQRLDMCRDLLAARGNLERAKETKARVLVSHRASAIRRALLGSGAGAPDLADELLSPTHTAARLTAVLDDLEGKTGAERTRGALYVEGIAQVMSVLMVTEAKLGVLAGATDYQGLASRARALLGGDAPAHSDHVIDASIGAGAFGDALRDELVAAVGAGERYKRANADAIEAAQANYDKATIKDRDFRSRYSELIRISDPVERVAKIEALYAEWDVFRAEQLTPAEEAGTSHNIAMRDATKNAQRAAGQKIIDRVLSASTVTPDQAAAWAAAQEITTQAKARLRKIGYAVDDVRSDMAEFYRITNGRLPSARIHSNGSRRANATDIEAHGKVGTINLDSSFDKRVLWHELGHHLEADPVAKAAAGRFIRRRSVDGKVRRLRDITGNRGYDMREVALEGNFFNPYVGKVYSDGVTEVFSMGVETLSDPAMLAKRATDDPQTLEFIAGYVAQPLDELGRAHMRLREMLRELNDDAKEQVANEVGDVLKEVAKLANFTPSEDREWMGRYDWMYDDYKVLGYFDIGGGKWWALSGKVSTYGSRRKVAGFYVVQPHDGGMQRHLFPSKEFELLKVAIVRLEKTGRWFNDIEHMKNDASVKELLK